MLYFSSLFINEIRGAKSEKQEDFFFFFKSCADRVRNYNHAVVLSPFLYTQFD